MSNYKVKYVISLFIYGTIGYFLHFISFPTEVVAMSRGLIGSLTLLIILKIKGKSLDKNAIKNNLKYLLLAGFSLGLNWVALFAAYRLSSVALGSLCNYMAPIFLVCISPLLFKEYLSIKKVLCIIGAFIGILLVSGLFENKISSNLVGISFGFIAALGFVLLIIFNRKLKDISTYDKAFVELLVCGLCTIPYVIINNIGNTISFDINSLLLTLMLGIIHTGVAYSFYFGSINDIPVSSVAILGYIEPVLSIVVSAIFLKETLSLYGIIGAVLIIFSACISELVK